MKVLIVAKTRIGGGSSVGAISEAGKSLRLITPDADRNPRFNHEYQVGSVWELIRYTPDPASAPPHTENIIVLEKRYLRPARNIIDSIEKLMPPASGGVETLFDGLIRHTEAGALYIARSSGVPSRSTTFWRPDQPLTLDDGGVRIRYRYPTPDGGRTLTFVGYQDPVEEIPAGTLLRVSLANWWSPPDNSETEPRCYAQLSGWFLPAGSEPAMPERETPVETAAEYTAADIESTLRRVFGYDRFRHPQEEIIRSVLAGQDSLVIMPTGGGKSLCFQVPALVFEGLTVVVSPLISLMQDQVGQLQELGVAAVALNSDLAYQARGTSMRRIRDGQIKLLYVAPETLKKPEILHLLDQCRVECLAIDEAHCISEWGHDFRPEYRELAEVRRRYPRAVCIALTATATPRVQRDIAARLRMRENALFISSFDRENLFLQVEPKSDPLNQTLDFIRRREGQAGIIYCNTKRQVDELVESLIGRGIAALGYHAGMEDRARRENQNRFLLEEAQIMVATVAFGMGIDKPNVRFVVHYDLPHDIENYYQQIGRAGRDGLRADCLLLYAAGDAVLITRLIQTGKIEEQERRRARLSSLIRWAESGECRRRAILQYFGEDEVADSCQMCDNCLGREGESEDLTPQARRFLLCVQQTGERFGADHVINVLRGSRNQRIRDWKHDRLNVYGSGADLSVRDWKQLTGEFLRQGLLERDDFQSLQLTAQGRAVLGGASVHGISGIVARRPAAASSSVAPASGPVDRRSPDRRSPVRGEPVRAESDRGRLDQGSFDQRLFDELRALRKRLADEIGMPPYIVFSDRALREMAAYAPCTEADLLRINGVGQYKLERYGEAFLSVIRDYCVSPDVDILRTSTRPVTIRQFESDDVAD